MRGCPEQSRLTRTSTLLGTPAYMSPEQVARKPTDRRTDVWSLAVVLYEMLSGRLPFEGQRQEAVLYAIGNEKPEPITALRAGLPIELEPVLAKALAKNPDERYQHVDDLALDLRLVQKGNAEQATLAATGPSGDSPGWRRWIVPAVLVWSAFLAGILLRSPQPQSPPTNVLRLTVATPPGVKPFRYLALSPDGGSLVFLALSGNEQMLWVHHLADAAARPLPGTVGAHNPFWSPDGRDIAFFAGGKLRRISVSGGPPLTLCDAYGLGGAWSEQERAIIFSAVFPSPLYRVSQSGGAPEQITDLAEGELSHIHPEFLPDGRSFVFVALQSDYTTVLRGGWLGSRETTGLGPIDSNVRYAAPGYLQYFREGAILAQPFDARSMRFSGDAVPVAEGVDFYRGNWYASFSPSSSGLLAFLQEDRQARLTWVNPSGDVLGTIGELGDYRAVSLSPDQRRLAVVRRDAGTGVRNIWTADLDRNLLSPQPASKLENLRPVWSADNDTVLVSTEVAGRATYQLGTLPLGARAAVDNLFPDPDRDRSDAMLMDASRDGEHLLFGLYSTPNRMDVLALSLAASVDARPLLQSPADERQARFSPDGNWVAYSSDESGRPEIYLCQFPGGGRKQRVSTAGGYEPCWRPDGNEIYYLDPGGTLMKVSVSGASGLTVGRPAPLFRIPVRMEFLTSGNTGDYSGHLYEVSADGQRFLIVQPIEQQSRTALGVVANWPALMDR